MSVRSAQGYSVLIGATVYGEGPLTPVFAVVSLTADVVRTASNTLKAIPRQNEASII